MTSEDEGNAPWITWGELPYVILALPFVLFLGMHVAGLAMLIRKWTRIPYLISMLILYTALTIPLWINRGNHSLWLPGIATAAILLCVLLPIMVRGREEMLDGTNVESAAPAHIVTCLVYFMAYLIYR